MFDGPKVLGLQLGPERPGQRLPRGAHRLPLPRPARGADVRGAVAVFGPLFRGVSGERKVGWLVFFSSSVCLRMAS